jgi:MoaA/NifB/PqqE/SkfB family radical SAM enzyme
MHIEPTSRCTLACPACPRTIIVEKFGSFPKQDLNLKNLVNFLDCASGRALKNLCLEGNHGDPIYYPHLMEMIDTFRSNKIFTIVTNGSYQNEKFWSQLADRLTEKDLIIFSIDGLEHNNHLYRKNSNWESIMLGLKIMKQSKAQVGWKTLIFDYNYNEIDQIRDFAESQGVKFISQTTSRFGNDSLRPPENLVDKTREYSDDTQNINLLKPQCQSHAKEYISADGYYWPCCWVSSAFTLYKTQLWKDRQQWSTTGKTLDIMREHLADWTDQLQKNAETADVVCKMMCKTNNKTWPVNHGLT